MIDNTKDYLKCFQNQDDYETQVDNVMGMPHVVTIKDTNKIIYNKPQEDTFCTQYLTFEAIDDCVFEFERPYLSYSLDNGSTWTELEGWHAVTPTVKAGSKIMWKAFCDPILGEGMSGYFCSDGRFNISGNLLSMFYGDDFIDVFPTLQNNYMVSGGNAIYGSGLFAETPVVDASNLVLPPVQYLYSGMFADCYLLTKGPVITLQSIDYDDGISYMYINCPNLREIVYMGADIYNFLDMLPPFGQEAGPINASEEGEVEPMNTSEEGVVYLNGFILPPEMEGLIVNGWTIKGVKDITPKSIVSSKAIDCIGNNTSTPVFYTMRFTSKDVPKIFYNFRTMSEPFEQNLSYYRTIDKRITYIDEKGNKQKTTFKHKPFVDLEYWPLTFEAIGDYLFIGGKSSTQNDVLRISTDNGSTWQSINIYSSWGYSGTSCRRGETIMVVKDTSSSFELYINGSCYAYGNSASINGNVTYTGAENILSSESVLF